MRNKRVKLGTDFRTWQETKRQEEIDRIVRENPRFSPTDKPLAADDLHRLRKGMKRR